MKQLELMCSNDSECMAFDYNKGSTLTQSIGSKCRSTKSELYKTATGFQICPIKKGVLVFLELLFLCFNNIASIYAKIGGSFPFNTYLFDRMCKRPGMPGKRDLSTRLLYK